VDKNRLVNKARDYKKALKNNEFEAKFQHNLFSIL